MIKEFQILPSEVVMNKSQKVFSAIGVGVVIGAIIVVVLKIIKNIKKHKIVRKWIYADGDEPTCI